MTRTEQMIQEALHKRAASEPRFFYVSPKAIRVNGEDMARFLIDTAEEREKRAEEFLKYFPEAAVRERTEARAMVGVKISLWVDPYCGRPMEVIYDDTVPRGTIVIVEADGEG